MARSVLNSLSTVEIVVIFVLGSVALAIGVSITIRRLFPGVGKGEFEDLASGLRVVYELMFALILAFVIASVLDKFNDAENTVGQESTALAQMVRGNAAFPTRAQERFDNGIDVYIQAVTNDEWETMKHGRRSPEAGAALETLYGLYSSYEPGAGAAEGEFYGQALDHLDELATARRERLALSAAELPTMLVIMLPIGAILLLILEYRPKLAPRSQAAFMGTLALVLSSTYLLTIVLDYPFSGDVSVSTAALHSGILAQFADTTPRKPQPGDKQLPMTAKDLDGVWFSDAYGTLLLRAEGRRVRGSYRIGKGTVNGSFSKGVFRGVWCQSTRKPADYNAGLVEWRRIRTKDGDTIITGVWGYGYKRLRNGDIKPAGDWGLAKLKRDKAEDLQHRLDTFPPSRFCHTH